IVDKIYEIIREINGQRWNAGTKDEILESRRLGTRHLVEGLAALDEAARPRALVSASGVDYYAPRGDEPIDESGDAGDHFPAQVCVAWEEEAQRAEELGLRVVRVRTAVVLHPSEGALAKMLPFFKLGIGGPIAGGRQYFPWISRQDIVGLYLAALDHPTFSGPLNAGAPQTATNKELSRTLGRVLRRPAFAPVPALAIKALYGEMAVLVTSGPRIAPGRADELGYTFQQPELEPALRAALGKS
ncbi:MAG TPA: TIGR01777 family oxidoreductase, partial [Baekduia sp.]|nr:TIGR01777 family oxidoreductase [Baekduia sp.]